MKIRVGGLAAIIGCAALCLTLPALGQNSITLTGVNGSTSSDNGGNLLSSSESINQYPNGMDVYTGIYYSTVDGTAMTPTICDDFNHNVNLGETWSATAVNTQSLNANNITQLEFGGGANAAVVYLEVATLVSEIFTLNNSTGTFDGLKVSGTDLSEAIWDITTPGGIKGITANALALVGYLEGTGTYGFGNYTAAQALAYLNKLNLWILTPSPNNGPQEFWAPGGPSYNVPEGGSALLYLLLAGASCFGAMFFRYRSEFANRGLA